MNKIKENAINLKNYGILIYIFTVLFDIMFYTFPNSFSIKIEPTQNASFIK